MLLALLTIFNVARGVSIAWQRAGDVDMKSRADEYAWFRQGYYPNAALEGRTVPPKLPYSVYPPYALPMFALFFEPGGLLQGRVLIELLSVASLVVLGLYAARELQFAGPAAVAIGTVAGGAITGNIGALAAGQFSILCVALIVQQILYLERRRPLAAGCCWALAMIKPQIALAFGVLFLVDKQWRGLVVGGAILVALSLFACWWTDIPPGRVLDHWLFRGSMSFAERDRGTPGPGQLAAYLGVNGRIVQFASLALLGCLAAGIWWRVRHLSDGIPLLPLAGACGVVGELLFYHQFYDHIMLAPAVIALFVAAAKTRSIAAIALATLVATSVWMPQRFLLALPYNQVGRVALWSAAAALLVTFALRSASNATAVEAGAV